MPKKSEAVDAYIEAAEPFAKPILKKVRRLFHKGCPDLEETVKWRFPHFELGGIVGSVAAFKKHVSMGFWSLEGIDDPDGHLTKVGNTEMGQMRLESVDDLPDDATVLAWVRAAAERRRAGGAKKAGKKKASKKKAAKKGTVPAAATRPPADLLAALKENGAAHETFRAFSPSNKRDYVEWVTEAKRDATRAKRIAQAVEWMAEGKPRNWKYMKTW